MSTSATTSTTRTLVLGLGNDILADDAIGLLAVRALRPSLDDSVDVQETSVHGVAHARLRAKPRGKRTAEPTLTREFATISPPSPSGRCPDFRTPPRLRTPTREIGV